MLQEVNECLKAMKAMDLKVFITVHDNFVDFVILEDIEPNTWDKIKDLVIETEWKCRDKYQQKFFFNVNIDATYKKFLYE